MGKILDTVLSIARDVIMGVAGIKICPKCNQSFQCNDNRRVYCIKCSKSIKSLTKVYRDLDWPTSTKKKKKNKKGKR